MKGHPSLKKDRAHKGSCTDELVGRFVKVMLQCCLTDSSSQLPLANPRTAGAAQVSTKENTKDQEIILFA